LVYLHSLALQPRVWNHNHQHSRIRPFSGSPTPSRYPNKYPEAELRPDKRDPDSDPTTSLEDLRSEPQEEQEQQVEREPVEEDLSPEADSTSKRLWTIDLNTIKDRRVANGHLTVTVSVPVRARGNNCLGIRAGIE